MSENEKSEFIPDSPFANRNLFSSTKYKTPEEIIQMPGEKRIFEPLNNKKNNNTNKYNNYK